MIFPPCNAITSSLAGTAVANETLPPPHFLLVRTFKARYFFSSSLFSLQSHKFSLAVTLRLSLALPAFCSVLVILAGFLIIVLHLSAPHPPQPPPPSAEPKITTLFSSPAQFGRKKNINHPHNRCEVCISE